MYRIFREIQVGSKYILRFYPSDNGWMCGISKEMMDEIEEQDRKKWVGLTDEEVSSFEAAGVWGEKDIRAIEKLLKEKNNG